MTPDRAVLLGKAGAMSPSTRKMLYDKPSADRPKRLTITCPIRVPRPHLMTDRATRNARTISRIVPFANPEYAFSAGKRLVSTAAATATTDAVRIGNALKTTEAIAAAKSAKRRHAATDKPAGGGANHIPAAATTIAVRTTIRDPVVVMVTRGVARLRWPDLSGHRCWIQQ